MIIYSLIGYRSIDLPEIEFVLSCSGAHRIFFQGGDQGKNINKIMQIVNIF
jgi:hypothetical protein